MMMKIRNKSLWAVILIFLLIPGALFAGTINYTYDPVSRLTGADYGGGKSIAYTYDKNGNLLERNVTAPSNQVTITVSADPAAGGTVTGGGTYDKNTQVKVTATANGGYDFVNWTEDGTQVSTSAEYTFTATADRTLVAHFTQAQQYTLQVAVNPTQRGTVTGNGINCPEDCTQTYDAGTAVQLTASPKTGNIFLRWKGGLTGTTNPDTVTMNADKQVTAYFGSQTGSTDTDGVPDSGESGPNGDNPAYDGNQNGVPDYQESIAASFKTASGGEYVTIGLPDTCATETLSEVKAQANPSPQDAPEGVQFPYGFFSFSIENLPQAGATIAAILYLPKNAAIATYYMYGPTPDNPSNHWYEFMYDGTTGAEIFHNANQTRVLLHFKDGERGDKDLTANGRIDDPGAPGLRANPIPTLNEWGLILLFLGLGATAFFLYKRRGLLG